VKSPLTCEIYFRIPVRRLLHRAAFSISLRTIVRWHHAALLPEEIAIRIGHISLAQVHAALAFYYADQEAMDREMAEEEAESDRIEPEHLARQRQKSGLPLCFFFIISA
jgi:hypothetical protein